MIILAYSRKGIKIPKINQSWYQRNGGTDRTSAGGVVARLEAGRIMIALAREPGLPRYVLPKGGVKSGESLEEAALREIHEEAGLDEVALIEKLDVLERYDLGKTRWITAHYFLGVTEQLDGIPADPTHRYHLAWAPLKDLPKMFWPEQHELIESNRKLIEDLIVRYHKSH